MLRTFESLLMSRAHATPAFWRSTGVRFCRRLHGLSRYPWPTQWRPRFVFAVLPERWRTDRVWAERAPFSERTPLREARQREAVASKRSLVAVAASPGKALGVRAMSMPPRARAPSRAARPATGLALAHVMSVGERPSRENERTVMRRVGVARAPMDAPREMAAVRGVRAQPQRARFVTQVPAARSFPRLERPFERRGARQARVARGRVVSPRRGMAQSVVRAWRHRRHEQADSMAATARQAMGAARLHIGVSDEKSSTVAQGRHRRHGLQSDVMPRRKAHGNDGHPRRIGGTARTLPASPRKRIRSFKLTRYDANEVSLRVRRAGREGPAIVAKLLPGRRSLRRSDRIAVAAIVRRTVRRGVSQRRRVSIAAHSRQVWRDTGIRTSSPARMIWRQPTAMAGSSNPATAASTHANGVHDSYGWPKSSQAVRSGDGTSSESTIAAARRIMVPLVEETLFSARTIAQLARDVVMQIDRRDSVELYRKSGGR